MSKRYINIAASPEILRTLQTELVDQSISFSEPLPSDSPADLLDSPIGAEQLDEVLYLATVALGTDSATSAFVAKLLAILREHGTQTAQIYDTVSGQKHGQIDAAMSEETATAVVSR